MNITKNFVEKLKLPSNGMTQKKYYDDTMKGFGIRITSNNVKSFFIEKHVNNKVYRTTLGQYPVLSTENARKKAQDFLGRIAMGYDPIAEAQQPTVTLQAAFADFLKARKNLKPNTISCYTRIIKIELSAWKNKSLSSITKDMISKRHTEIGENSKALANLVMKLLRGIFTFAIGSYSNITLTENPVKVLSHTRSWYSIARRNTIITPPELPAWCNAVNQLPNQLQLNDKVIVVKDYLLLVLFTGLRKQEAAKLRWSDIDFNNKTLTVANTKNHLNHTLPLSDFLLQLLRSRRDTNNYNSKYVFPGNGKAGHLVDPQKQIDLVIKMSRVQFILHDLRRTFVTVAESIDIPAYTLKRLLNHKSQDITGGYICIDTERLRKPMQLIADKLLMLMNTVNIEYTNNIKNIALSIKSNVNYSVALTV